MPAFLRNMKLRTKITVFSVFIILLTVLSVSYVSFEQSKASLERSIQSDLNNVAKLKADKIAVLFKGLTPNIRLVQQYEMVQSQVTLLSQHVEDRTSEDYTKVRDTVDQVLVPFLRNYDFEDVQLLNPSGRIVYTANRGTSSKVLGQQFQDPDGQTLVNGAEDVYMSEIFRKNDKFYMYMVAPVRTETGKYVGMIVCKHDMAPIFDFIRDYTGLGTTGETLIGELRGTEVVFLNPLRHDTQAALKRKVTVGSPSALPVQEAAQGRAGMGLDIDYRHKEVSRMAIHSRTGLGPGGQN